MTARHDEVARLTMHLTTELAQMELRAAALKMRILSVESACVQLRDGPATRITSGDDDSSTAAA